MRVGSSGGDGKGQDEGVEAVERCGDVRRATLLGPDDDRRAGARQGDAGSSGRQIVAQREQQRRVLVTERLVEAVVEGCGEKLGIAGSDRGAEERSPGGSVSR